MTTELVFLMSALKGGDIRKWLGEDNIRKLEAKDAELLKQASTEFSAMRTRLGEDADPAVTRWTMYQLPVATQAGMVEPIRFYHREQGERDAQRVRILTDWSGPPRLQSLHFQTGRILPPAAR